jgi:hypothetical protein
MFVLGLLYRMKGGGGAAKLRWEDGGLGACAASHFVCY